MTQPTVKGVRRMVAHSDGRLEPTDDMQGLIEVPAQNPDGSVDWYATAKKIADEQARERTSSSRELSHLLQENERLRNGWLAESKRLGTVQSELNDLRWEMAKLRTDLSRPWYIKLWEFFQ